MVPTHPDMDFQHEPLDITKSSIRLLRVLPRRDDGGVVCEIGAVELPVAYATLSYHWGPPGGEHAITLVSSTTGQSGITRVRENLFEFLSRASATEEYRRQRWWIDALCIDQAHVEERNHQVQQMGSIYAGAKRVHIWLGLDPLIGRLFTYVHKYWKHRSNKSLSNDTFLTKVMHDYRCVEGISRLRTHPYWSRLWIIQEILLSEELLVVAGHLSIPWEYLSILVETGRVADAAATADDSTSPAAASNLTYLLTHRPGHQEQVSEPFRHDFDLLEVLDLSATSFCQDARDKVYGVLALIRHDLRLPVDYHISVDDLFHKACSFYSCWVDPEKGLGLVRRLADALEIDLQAMAASSHSSALHTFIIELVELEKRFGRGTVRINCTECGADLASAVTALSRSNIIPRVWCIRMGTRSWLHVFFDRHESLQRLSIHAVALQDFGRDQHGRQPRSVLRQWSDVLEGVGSSDLAQHGSIQTQQGWTSMVLFHLSQRYLLLMAGLT